MLWSIPDEKGRTLWRRYTTWKNSGRFEVSDTAIYVCGWIRQLPDLCPLETHPLDGDLAVLGDLTLLT